jgi:hypothetical protein
MQKLLYIVTNKIKYMDMNMSNSVILYMTNYM